MPKLTLAYSSKDSAGSIFQPDEGSFCNVCRPICMFEAIFSYRAPLYKLPHRKCVIPITYLY